MAGNETKWMKGGAREVRLTDQAFLDAKGYAVILPRFEPSGVFRRVGKYMVFACFRRDAFGLGFQALRAGLMIEVGPVYVGICHIAKQVAPPPPTEQMT